MKDCKGIEGSLDERSASGRVGGSASRREGDMREADAQQMPKMGFGGEQEKREGRGFREVLQCEGKRGGNLTWRAPAWGALQRISG